METGKSPLIPAPELERLGFKMVIFPVSALLTVYKAVVALMARLKEQGTTAADLENMGSLAEVFEAVGLSQMLARDSRYAGDGPER